MIRSVSRAAARLASKPTALTTATTARTTILRTSLTATTITQSPIASFSSLTPTNSNSVTSSGSAPAPANIRSLKRDIARLIDEDTADLATAPDQGLLDYVKEQHIRITQDKDGIIRLTRSVGDYTVVAQFMAETDEEGGEGGMGGMGGEDKDGENEDGKGEGEDEEDDNRLPAHQWEVDITNTTAPQHNVLRLACMTSKQGQYTIEAITFDPQPINPATTTAATTAAMAASGLPDLSSVDERKQLYFDELSEAAQDKMFELLESVGVDDKLGQFVQHYAQVVRTQQYLDKLKMLKLFLQQ